jgi:hypothetical protein
MTSQGIRTFTNAFRDESLFVPCGVGLDEIPNPFRKLIDKRYQRFLEKPADCLKQLAKKARFLPVKEWMVAQSQSDSFGLIVHRAEICGTIQHDLTVCCTRTATMKHRYFRLPNQRPYYKLVPDPLSDVYRVTDGIIERFDAFSTSQFVKADGVNFDFVSSYPIEPGPISDFSNVLRFYDSDCGDCVVADGETAYVFSHETCSFKTWGKLTDLIESYFTSDLAGRSWNPFRELYE